MRSIAQRSEDFAAFERKPDIREAGLGAGDLRSISPVLDAERVEGVWCSKALCDAGPVRS
jgi:hypothetical protein